MSTDDMLLALRALGLHPHLAATESGAKDRWMSWVRGGPTLYGPTPEAVLVKLSEWVGKTEPPTTSQLRRAGAA